MEFDLLFDIIISLYQISSMTSNIYFLIKFYGNGAYVAYGSGVSVHSISELHTCRIMRWYPTPMKDITPYLERLQLHWRAHLHWRRWHMNPRRIQERAMYGRWAPMQQNALILSQ